VDYEDGSADIGKAAIELLIQSMELAQIIFSVLDIIIPAIWIEIGEAGADVFHLDGGISQRKPDMRIGLFAILLEQFDAERGVHNSEIPTGL